MAALGGGTPTASRSDPAEHTVALRAPCVAAPISERSRTFVGPSPQEKDISRVDAKRPAPLGRSTQEPKLPEPRSPRKHAHSTKYQLTHASG